MGLFATANGNVVGNSTVSVGTACSLTRINASVFHAALFTRTIRV